MWARRQCGLLLMMASWAAAQGTIPGAVSVQDLRVVRDPANNLRVEITLSAPSNTAPSVTVATNPSRLVLDLPNTLSGAKQQQLSVNYKGVRRVRLGLNSAVPPITRVVVEMDEAHPYSLQSEGRRVTLVISPAPNAIASSGQGAQAAGVSGGLVGIFRRRPTPPPMETGNDSATGLPPPPPHLPPISSPKSKRAVQPVQPARAHLHARTPRILIAPACRKAPSSRDWDRRVQEMFRMPSHRLRAEPQTLRVHASRAA